MLCFPAERAWKPTHGDPLSKRNRIKAGKFGVGAVVNVSMQMEHAMISSLRERRCMLPVPFSYGCRPLKLHSLDAFSESD